MSTDYQRKKNNPFYLPRTLYRRVLAVIRDYPRQIEEINNILYGSAGSDGSGVGSSAPKCPTEEAAIRLEKYRADTDAIEKALVKIPEEYKKGIMRNIVYGERFPDIAHYNTWLRWRAKFIWNVAEKLKLI